MMRAGAITLRSLPKQAVLLDQLFIALDSDTFQQVTTMLDAACGGQRWIGTPKRDHGSLGES